MDEPAEMLTEEQVSKRLKVSRRTLRRWRELGQGPPWLRLSERVARYPADELERWLHETRQGR